MEKFLGKPGGMWYNEKYGIALVAAVMSNERVQSMFDWKKKHETSQMLWPHWNDEPLLYDTGFILDGEK